MLQSSSSNPNFSADESGPSWESPPRTTRPGGAIGSMGEPGTITKVLLYKLKGVSDHAPYTAQWLILPSAGGDPKRAEQDAIPPFSFTFDLRKNNNDDQNTFFHLILDPSDKVGNVCIDARCGLGMDNFRRKKVHRIC